MRLACLAIALLMPAMSAAEKTRRPAGDVPAGDVDRGRKVFYEQSCYACHGYNGQTGAHDLVGTKSAIVADETTFIWFLRGRADAAPLLPSTAMPNYPERSLSDAQARDLYAFVNALRRDAPAVREVPAFKKILHSAKQPYRRP